MTEPLAARALRVGAMLVGYVIFFAVFGLRRGLFLSFGVTAIAASCVMTLIKQLHDDATGAERGRDA